MLKDLGNGLWFATGTLSRDAKFSYVGAKNTPKTSFSLIAGKRQGTTTIFVDCVCWRNLAMATSIAAKGDSAAVVGHIEEREYNGKVYKDLVCEWANIAGGEAAAASAPMPGVVSTSSYSDLQDADGELPF